MTREISTPIVLNHTNLVPGSEIVSIKGSSIPALIRDSDYIIDYINGEIRFLTDGAALNYVSLIEQFGVDVIYSYQINFADPKLFESQIEVFDEVASRVSDFTISVANSPVQDVSRIYNLTTQEEYVPQSINNNEIAFSGINAPRLKTFNKSSTSLLSTLYDPIEKRFSNTFLTSYPSNLSVTLNPMVDLTVAQSLISFPYLLIIGGEESLPTTITVLLSREASDIQLVTGGRTLKTSSVLLTPGVDFTFVLTSFVAFTSFKQATISLAPSAIQKIRTNNLYMNLAFTETTTLLTQGQFQTLTHNVNELVSFVLSNTQSLTRFIRQVDFGDIGDVSITPTIIVVDANTGFVYEEHIDYEINTTQRKITKLLTGRISQQVVIYYVEKRFLTVDFTLIFDTILADYIWGNNSLNWDGVKKIVPTTQVSTLKKNTQLVILNNIPLDSTDILIYLEGDFSKTPLSTPVSFNKAAHRLMITPVPTDGAYVFEYSSVSQPIPEGTAYFVSYKYGATRSVLRDRFARLVGIDETQTQRDDIIALVAGATTTQLTMSPISLDTILIFNEGDFQETPVATATNFDNITKTLTFTSLTKASRVVFRYVTTGFDTKSLRNAVVKLFESFPIGPTLAGFENIISGFTDQPADIQSGLANRFVLPNENHTSGNQIAQKKFEASPLLGDGSDSVTFLPARFNLGALFESNRGGFVTAPSVSNIGITEGTLEFLTGVVFNPDDNKEHFFVDILGKDPNKNRFSIYKSKNNKLNFDIWDNLGQLFRSSVDVSEIYHTEIIKLKVGDSQATLSFDATAAQLDLNNNSTPDLYEALETKFIIMPETPTFPASFKKASIKVLGYDAPTRVVSFEPVSFSGRYVFSYVGGLVKYEETDNFIAVTWKLHTHDGNPPFYRLYINGRRVINQTLQDINISIADSTKSSYDTSKYDIDTYEE